MIAPTVRHLFPGSGLCDFCRTPGRGVRIAVYPASPQLLCGHCIAELGANWAPGTGLCRLCRTAFGPGLLVRGEVICFECQRAIGEYARKDARLGGTRFSDADVYGGATQRPYPGAVDRGPGDVADYSQARDGDDSPGATQRGDRATARSGGQRGFSGVWRRIFAPDTDRESASAARR